MLAFSSISTVTVAVLVRHICDTISSHELKIGALELFMICDCFTLSSWEIICVFRKSSVVLLPFFVEYDAYMDSIVYNCIVEMNCCGKP